MASVTLNDIQTDLRGLVARVSRGEVIEIVEHGEVLARLVPAGEETSHARSGDKNYWGSLLARAQALPRVDVSPEEIAQWRREGAE